MLCYNHTTTINLRTILFLLFYIFYIYQCLTELFHPLFFRNLLFDTPHRADRFHDGKNNNEFSFTIEPFLSTYHDVTMQHVFLVCRLTFLTGVDKTCRCCVELSGDILHLKSKFVLKLKFNQEFGTVKFELKLALLTTSSSSLCCGRVRKIKEFNLLMLLF